MLEADEAKKRITRIGDLENDNWQNKYKELSKKHQQLISFYNVELNFCLASYKSRLLISSLDFEEQALSFFLV